MKFFKPELFLRFNSPDDQIADQADEEWERAIQEYRSHLDRLRDQMPDQAIKLASLCFHDAELLAVEPSLPKSVEPDSTWSDLAILSVKQGEEIVSLVYLLGDHVRRHASEDPWPFSKQRTHWLYDEVDIAPNRPDLFFHRVLLSDGTIIEVPFVTALIHIIPLQPTEQVDSSKRIA